MNQDARRHAHDTLYYDDRTEATAEHRRYHRPGSAAGAHRLCRRTGQSGSPLLRPARPDRCPASADLAHPYPTPRPLSQGSGAGAPAGGFAMRSCGPMPRGSAGNRLPLKSRQPPQSRPGSSSLRSGLLRSGAWSGLNWTKVQSSADCLDRRSASRDTRPRRSDSRRGLDERLPQAPARRFSPSGARSHRVRDGLRPEVNPRSPGPRWRGLLHRIA